MKLTQQQLEAHLWGAANILRGKTAGQDYKNYILSLMFYKRLCDQLGERSRGGHRRKPIQADRRSGPGVSELGRRVTGKRPSPNVES
jgi:type I restriction-modification system DNA methylase subunit